jgi:hypothetical protein
MGVMLTWSLSWRLSVHSVIFPSHGKEENFLTMKSAPCHTVEYARCRDLGCTKLYPEFVVLLLAKGWSMGL